MARRLIWAPEAIIDLNEIVEHIAEDDEILAKQFARQIIEQVEMIPSFLKMISRFYSSKPV